MKLIDLLTGRKPRGAKPGKGAPPETGECFPESGSKVPYPNPHPGGKTGSFPDAPKLPGKPSLFRGLGI